LTRKIFCIERPLIVDPDVPEVPLAAAAGCGVANADAAHLNVDVVLDDDRNRDVDGPVAHHLAGWELDRCLGFERLD
jgi:hypothetical protein